MTSFLYHDVIPISDSSFLLFLAETTTTVQAETTGSSTIPATTTREKPSVTTNEVVTVETTQEQTMSTFPAECSHHGWTEWMNSYRPDNLGDFESIPNLRTKYKFCAKPDSISCRSVNSGKSFDSNGKYGVTCNTNGGLSCVNALQEDNECDDYEVRLYCVCASSPLVTTEAAAGSVGITEGLTTQAITEKLTTSMSQDITIVILCTNYQTFRFGLIHYSAFSAAKAM